MPSTVQLETIRSSCPVSRFTVETTSEQAARPFFRHFCSLARTSEPTLSWLTRLVTWQWVLGASDAKTASLPNRSNAAHYSARILELSDTVAPSSYPQHIHGGLDRLGPDRTPFTRCIHAGNLPETIGLYLAWRGAGRHAPRTKVTVPAWAGPVPSVKARRGPDGRMDERGTRDRAMASDRQDHAARSIGASPVALLLDEDPALPTGMPGYAPADPHIIVLFGATGDLAKRKLLPGLFHLSRAGMLPDGHIVATSLELLNY